MRKDSGRYIPSQNVSCELLWADPGPYIQALEETNHTSAAQKHSGKKQGSQDGDGAPVRKRNKNITYLVYLGYHGPISQMGGDRRDSVSCLHRHTGNRAHFLSPPQDYFTSTVVVGRPKAPLGLKPSTLASTGVPKLTELTSSYQTKTLYKFR